MLTALKSGQGSLGAVPEPTSLILAALGCVDALVVRPSTQQPGAKCNRRGLTHTNAADRFKTKNPKLSDHEVRLRTLDSCVEEFCINEFD